MQRANNARGLRFLPKVAFITTAVVISAALAYQASAQNVYTAPVGFITLNVQGTTGSPIAPASSFLGLGMTQIPVQSGIVASMTSNSVTDASGNWTNNQFSSAGTPCEIEFLEPTGSPTNWAFTGLIDEVVASPAGGTLYTYASDGNLAGYRYQIRPSWTLISLFGATDQAGLQTGTGSGNADNVDVWNPNTQTYATYYYRTGAGWRSSASPTVNAGTNVLYLDQGILLVRRAAASTNVMLLGGVKYADANTPLVGQTIVPIVASGSTIPGNVYATSIPLGKSGLYTTNSVTGVQSGTGSGNADNVDVWNPATQTFATYYYRTGSGWRSSASPTIDASTNTIPLGASVLILRRNANAFNWIVPQIY